MSIDYKDSLNLPKTAFPMKANLPQKELEILAIQKNLYETLLEYRKNKPLFILHDGPPYANGPIHLGHAVNKVLKDIILKSKALSGYNTPYIPGWDCHGLPIELSVEKKIGKAGKDIAPRDFRMACRKYAQEQVEQQKADFQRLGVIANWKQPYQTMDYSFEAEIIRIFGQILKKGYIYRGYKPVYWCSACASALAEAEVEYYPKLSPAIDVLFECEDSTSLLKCFGIFQPINVESINFPIWTTTPWTLPANQALVVHPKFNYTLIIIEKKALVIAEALIDSALKRYTNNETSYTLIASCPGQSLEGLKAYHPFQSKTVPILLGEHVTLEMGTGIVHTAPAHGQEDYIIGLQYGLPIENLMDNQGRFLQHISYVGSLPALKANDIIINLLQEKQKLLAHTQIEHSYPHCWRHKTPLILRATNQWFISVQALCDTSLKAIENVKWIPALGENMMEAMIKNRNDWCISRQRNWSAPITLFIHKETGDLHPQSLDFFEIIAQKVEEAGIDAWFELDPKTLGIDTALYEKVIDTLDVWFDSGVTHTAVLKKFPSLHFPADLYLEGSDQHRGWFQSSLLTSIALYETAPYKQVLTHGFTVDASGHKMSKSLGNVITPHKIIQSLGADILRLWIAATDYTAEMSISEEILERISESYRRIRNTARYLLANLHDFDPSIHCIPFNDLLALDQWAIQTAQNLQNTLIHYYQDYKFHWVYQKIYHFCIFEMGSFYLDIIKDRQYTLPANSLPRRSAQTTMYYILSAFVRWISPILSFTAEEIWKYIPQSDTSSIFFKEWYQDWSIPSDYIPAVDLQTWDTLRNIKNIINKELEQYRAQGKIGSALETHIELYVSEPLYKILYPLQKELRFIFITSEVSLMLQSYACDSKLLETERNDVRLNIHILSCPKCIRCWHYRADIGKNLLHPQLCNRCIGNITDNVEVRKFA